MALASPPLANRVLPAVAPPNAPPPPNYQPRDPGLFRGTAPTPTSYGNFVAPTPGTLSDAGKFRLDQGIAARQRTAAARGNLLSTTALKNVEDFAQGNASQEYQNDYNRALQTYDTNRDTNAQNFGQQHTSYGDSLAGFGANTSATFGYNNDAQAAAYGNYDRATAASVRDQNFRQAENDRNAAQQNLAQMPADSDFAAQAESVRTMNAQNQAQQQQREAESARSALLAQQQQAANESQAQQQAQRYAAQQRTQQQAAQQQAAQQQASAAQQNLAQMGYNDDFARQVEESRRLNATAQAQPQMPSGNEVVPSLGRLPGTPRSMPQGLPRPRGLSRGLAAAGY